MSQLLAFTETLSAKELRSVKPGRVLNTAIKVTIAAAANLPPRYEIAVVDCDAYKSGQCCVLIIPQGRECEFSFSVDEGRLDLAKSAGFERMVFVTLGRGHKFKSLTMIQTELNSFMRQLAPGKALSSGAGSIPYVTPSSDEDIGSRVEICSGRSEYSGEWVIEEVPDLGAKSLTHVLRRLIFLSNRALIQSEARRRLTENKLMSSSLSSSSSASASTSSSSSATAAASPDFDFSYLACGHHEAMVAGFAWSHVVHQLSAKSSSTLNAALIGLGGGLFSMYLHEAFPALHLDCIELDPEIVRVASNHFGFNADSQRLSVYVMDGLDYVRQKAGLPSPSVTVSDDSKSSDGVSSSSSSTSSSVLVPPTKLDILMIDVDSKNLSSGLSCPPPSFVTLDFFRQIHAALNSRGVFLLNLVCRAKQLFQDIVADAKSVFASVHQLPVPGDVNVVLICVAHDSKSSPTSTSNEEKSVAQSADDSKSAATASSSVMNIQPSASIIKSIMTSAMSSSIDLEKLVCAVQVDQPLTPAAASATESAKSDEATSSSNSKKKNKKKK